MAWLGSAWRGVAWLGVAWLGVAWLGSAVMEVQRKEIAMSTATLFDLAPPSILPDDNPRTRKADPVTSHEAADSNDVARSHRLVIAFLRVAEQAAQWEAEAFMRGDLSPSRIRSAFSELEALGKVRRTDETRLTPSGRRAQVWALS